MKWLVGVLVIANVSYFGYQFSIAAPQRPGSQANEQAQPEAQHQSMGGLLLLTELDSNALRPRRPRLPAADAVVPQVATDSVAEAAADSDSEAVDKPQRKAQAESALPAAAPPMNGPSLDETNIALVEQSIPSASCFTVGPLDNAAPITRLTSWFKARSLSTRLSRAERREVAFHWVYFAPLANRKEALAKVAAMRDKGIDDMVVMRKGDMAHGISLGAFSRAAAAKRRVRELRAKGYEPLIDVRHFVRRSRWMDVVARNNLPEADFSQAFPALQINERGCERSELGADEVEKKST